MNKRVEEAVMALSKIEEIVLSGAVTSFSVSMTDSSGDMVVYLWNLNEPEGVINNAVREQTTPI